MSRFFSYEARITRTRLIAGLLLSLPAVGIAILLLRTGKAWALILAGVLMGVVLAKLLTEAVRRRHDASASGAAAVWLLMGGTAAMSAAMVIALGSGAFIIPYAVLLLVAICWTYLLLRPGDPAPNSYGPPAPGWLKASFGARHRNQGTLAAIALTLIGGCLGYADVRWINTMRVHHAAVQHQVAIDQAVGNTAAPDALETAYQKQKPQ